ncbi:MAG: nitronate monooxygenase [Thermoplasmata archaeon]|nr:nitronate monooxygenase [Thermoplasmata archaeon]
MLRTKFTDLVGCTVPIQLAGMGQLSTPKLAAAVANAGGLGMLGWGGAPAEFVEKWLDETRRLTRGPCGMNFIVPGLVDEATGKLEPEAMACVHAAATHARVVEFFYAEPDPALISAVHKDGALASWQVGSPTEAATAEKSGCDFIVAQGSEAGGHVRGKIGVLALLAEVLPSATIPVVAAGGIGTGRAMAAALAAGAAGVRVGTRFVAADESEAHPRYVDRLIAASAGDTVLTEAFSTNWPHAPHRVLRGCVEFMQKSSKEVVGERVYQWAPDERVPVHRGDSIVPMRSTTGDIDAMPHWAGESVAAVRRVQPAAEIVRELAEEAQALLERRTMG